MFIEDISNIFRIENKIVILFLVMAAEKKMKITHGDDFLNFFSTVKCLFSVLDTRPSGCVLSSFVVRYFVRSFRSLPLSDFLYDVR